jgi:hypothetical protein
MPKPRMPKWRRMLSGTRPSFSGPGSMSSSAITSNARVVVAMSSSPLDLE